MQSAESTRYDGETDDELAERLSRVVSVSLQQVLQRAGVDEDHRARIFAQVAESVWLHNMFLFTEREREVIARATAAATRTSGDGTHRGPGVPGLSSEPDPRGRHAPDPRPGATRDVQ